MLGQSAYSEFFLDYMFILYNFYRNSCIGQVRGSERYALGTRTLKENINADKKASCRKDQSTLRIRIGSSWNSQGNRFPPDRYGYPSEAENGSTSKVAVT